VFGPEADMKGVNRHELADKVGVTVSKDKPILV
jgi:hypothetical protein